MTVPQEVKLARHAGDLDDSGHDTYAVGVTVDDEGTPLATAGTTLNFVGSGVVASGTGATKTITISGGGGAASAVTLADTAGFFTATDVEAAFAELALKDIGYTAHGNTGATETFDALTGWHSATLNANCTFTFTGATSGLLASMVLELLQDGTGSRLVTWPGSVVWGGGTAPVLSTAAGSTDILTFFSRDGGTTWFGFATGGSGGSALTVKDEGGALATAATSLDFVGAGVVASGTGAAKTITIAGASTAAAITALGFVGPLLIADTHSTPLVFADLIQNEAGSDLLYADL